MLSSVGNFLFRFRNTLFPFACLFLFLPGPHPFRDPLSATAVGTALAALGQLVRAATIGLRYVIRGGRNRRIYADDLVTEGIYSHTRNPMYVGNLLIAGGVAVVSNSWATIAVAIPLSLLMYISIVAAEEQYLEKRFGEAFRAYCRDVPRWLPRLSGLSATLSSMQFRWRRVLLKEYGTPFGWIGVSVLVTLYNLWRAGQWNNRTVAIHALGAVLGVACLFWLAAWSIKKSRYLVAD